MKKFLTAFLFVAFSAVTASAQTPPTGSSPSATLVWVAPSPVGGSGVVSGYNVYKSVSGSAYVKINSTLIAGLTTTDSSVLGGQKVSYCATTVDSNSLESVCSIAVSAVIPTNPNPPTLTITNLAIINVNGQDRLQVDWSDTNNGSTAFTIFGGQGQVLKQASQSSSIGVYSYAILIPVQSGSIAICDSQACINKTFQGI